MQFEKCAMPAGHRRHVNDIFLLWYLRWSNVLVEGACLVKAARVSVITLESAFCHLISNTLVDAQDNDITNLSHPHHVSKAQTATAVG